MPRPWMPCNRSPHTGQGMCWAQRCSWWRLRGCGCCILGTTAASRTAICRPQTCRLSARTSVRDSGGVFSWRKPSNICCCSQVLFGCSITLSCCYSMLRRIDRQMFRPHGTNTPVEVVSLYHAVIVEATYGVNRHEERTQREKRLVETVRGIVSRGGRVLMPVVALGRAQVPLALIPQCTAVRSSCSVASPQLGPQL
jgi:hypothetical protein